MLISRNFINMIVHNKIILASSSSSRYQILKKSGVNFQQTIPLCKEDDIKKKLSRKKYSPSAIAKHLSYEKSISVSRVKKYHNYNVVGCDTLIYLNNQIFDKAKNMNEAKKKILKLSGKTHNIVSGLTICKKGRKVWQCSQTTKVKIRKLNITQVDNYLKTVGAPILQSVGCYQIESLGAHIIEEIKGDFFNVMGLPLFKLLKYLNNIK